MKALILALFCASTPTLCVGVVDTLDTADNFFGSFGGTTATDNGDGTVTITRNTADVDAGIDWRNGASNLDVGTEGLLTVTPVAPFNGGFWGLTLMINDSSATLHQLTWIGDTQTTLPQSTNVLEFALANGVTTPVDYWLRFRVQPFDQTDVGFTFTEIAAIPEPSTVVLVCAACAVLLVFVGRRI